MRLQCFHACRTCGGKEVVSSRVPFLSEDSDRTWLSQGYYFWYEDKSLADWWGRTAIKKEAPKIDYAIVEVTLDFTDQEHKLLDLVGSPSDIDEFHSFLETYKAHLDKVAPRKSQSVTVSGCIKHFRSLAKTDDPDVFPIAAIKVADKKVKSLQDYKFTHKTQERIALSPRQQICLFEGEEQFILETKFHKPKEWCE